MTSVFVILASITKIKSFQNFGDHETHILKKDNEKIVSPGVPTKTRDSSDIILKPSNEIARHA